MSNIMLIRVLILDPCVLLKGSSGFFICGWSNA